MNTKVMVVDDDPDILSSMSLLLDSLGYQSITLSEPADILDTVVKERPDVILQDLKIPGLSVAGLVAALRLDPRTAEVPLVFFSAGTDLPTTAARYDAWGYLAKPFGREELARTLHHILGGEAPHVEASGSAIIQEVRDIFHDFWNLLAAVSNYTMILGDEQNLSPAATKSVQGLEKLILTLESKTDRLNAYILGLVRSLEPVGTSTQGARSGDT